MKVAIIGSNSFSGSSFVNYLISKKIKVFGFSRSNEVKKIFAPYKKNNLHKKYFKFTKVNLKISKILIKL